MQVKSMGFISFEEDEEEAEKAIEERKRQREIYVKERVNKLMVMWNKTKVTDEFEKETDPFVILEVQKKLHSELNDDFKTNIENMQRYLTKKDANLYKKQDTAALTSHLTKMQTQMMACAQKDNIFSLNIPMNDDEQKETLEAIQSCL